MLKKFTPNSKFVQGVFRPQNKHKYLGQDNPIYRSSYELRFFRWADLNENVIKWGSEVVIVPYISPVDGKTHRYFVDNFVYFKIADGSTKKFLIEIKPSGQTVKPESSGNKRKSTILHEQLTWIVNQAKWEAAKKWAKDRNVEFLVLTEKDIGIY